MLVWIILALIVAFVAGVAEANRVINEVHKVAAELHLRLAEIEKKVGIARGDTTSVNG